VTSRDFCYWVQGFFELTGKTESLSKEQVKTIQQHLAMVFKHEIDPSMGDKAHQDKLTEIHKKSDLQEDLEESDKVKELRKLLAEQGPRRDPLIRC